MSNNGTGRKYKTYPYTFKSSGYEVRYRRVPRTLNMDLRRAAESESRRAGSYPLPPQQKVMIFGMEESVEENLQDPKYIAAMGVWSGQVGQRITRVVITRGLVEWDQEAVSELKEQLAAMGEGGALVDNDGKPIDDRVLFVYQIAAGSVGEISDFLEAIHDKSGPSEAAIAEHASSFPGEAGEARHPADQGAR